MGLSEIIEDLGLLQSLLKELELSSIGSKEEEYILRTYRAFRAALKERSHGESVGVGVEVNQTVTSVDITIHLYSDGKRPSVKKPKRQRVAGGCPK